MIGEEEKRKKIHVDDAEEVKAILEVVSKEVPGLIKGIMGSVFSEQAGRDMGKAAGAFYQELKESGVPDEVAVKMTEDYMKVFTNLGSIVQKFGSGKKSSELGKEIESQIKKKLAEKGLQEDEE